METKLSRQSLNFALAVVDKVIGGDIPLPQLALIKVSCFIGYAQFQATNLETYLTIQVPVEQTLEAGAVCVSAERFLKLAKAGSGRVKLFTKNGNLVVQSGDAKGETFLMPVGEFPTFPVPNYQSTLPTKLLLSAIEKVGFAVAKHKDAMGYKYLLVDGEGGSVNFVASDVYRFAIFRAEVPFEGRIKLPYSSLEVVKELLEKEGKEAIKVGRTEEFVFLAGTDWEMAFRVKYWEHPDYKAVIPKEFKTRIVLDIEELDRALKEFLNAEEVVFQMDKGLKLTAKRAVEMEINATVEGQALNVAFNPKLIKEFTKTNKGTVEILLVDNKRPAVFKLGENYLYLLIPKKDMKGNNS
jgi:DNA polymerase-3 subunit beta